MRKIFKADKDTYISDKIVNGVRKTSSNVGGAGTIDLFKIEGAFFSGSTPLKELSRALIHFDLTTLKQMYANGEIDPGDSSFWCKMHLTDVYGGQTTPSNFNVNVFPLSASFDEGIGRDVAYFSDSDVCNWFTSSAGTQWILSGCAKGDGSTALCDYITSSANIFDTKSTQFFKTGDEDLLVDVTALVSATLSGELPDSGFRISFENTIEDDSYTYFVKRFASRTAYDESKRPKLLVGFDDSIVDDTQNLTLDTTCQLVLYNYSGGSLTNLVSGTSLTPILGSDCLLLKLSTQVSGGYYDLVFTGSQYTKNAAAGTYTAEVTIPSADSVVSSKLAESGSITFTPVWSSLDGTVSYVSGSKVAVRRQDRVSSQPLKNYVVSVLGLSDTYDSSTQVFARVHIFDQSSPLIAVTKLPVELPGIVIKNVHYQIRDTVTGETVMPFDDVKNSTRVSSDANGMFFKFHTEDLTPGRTYTVDLMIAHNGMKKKYLDVAPVFRVERASN